MSVQLNKETDVAIILRIADLIEKGSQGAKQVTGMYFVEDGVCAIGACLKAVGIDREKSMAWNFSLMSALDLKTWPRVEVPDGHEPFAYSGTTAPLIDVIIHMNDKLGWNFEKIVLWLRDTAAAMVTPETA